MTGSLIEQLAARLRIPQDTAADALADLVDEIREELDATGSVTLPGIGTLRRANGTLAFRADDALTAAANAGYAGLKAITVGDAETLPFEVPDERPARPAPEPPVEEEPELEEQEDAFALMPEDVEEPIDEVAATVDEPLPETEPATVPAEEPAEPEEGVPAVPPPAKEEPPFEPPAVFPIENVPPEIERRLEEQDAEAVEAPLATEEQPPAFAPVPEEVLEEDEALQGDERQEHTAPSEPAIEGAEEEAAVAAGGEEAAEPVPAAPAEEDLAATVPQEEAPAEVPEEEAEAGAGPQEDTYPEEAVAAIASSTMPEGEPVPADGPRRPTGQAPPTEASDQPEEQGRSRGLALAVGAVVLLLLLVGGYFVLEAMQEETTGDEVPDVVQTEPLAEPPAPEETGDEPTVQEEETPAEEAPEAPPPEEPAAPETPPAIDPAQGGWTIVAASTTSRAEAEAGVERFRDRLGDRFPVSIVESSADGVTRYRVAIGQFDTRARAIDQQEALGQQLPPDAWTLSLQ